MIAFLLKQPKIDLNPRDHEENTPLHLATFFERQCIVADITFVMQLC